MKAIGNSIYFSRMSPAASTEVAHRRVSAGDLKLRENWFRDAIYNNPELVIAPCRAGELVPEEEAWLPWDTEFPLNVGKIDVLLVSSSGRIGLVETKLSFNPEKRREVVAQVLEYALALQELDVSLLPDLPDDTNAPDEEDVAEHLAAGNFLLIVAGDALDPRAIRLAQELVGRHLISGWSLGMVDLNLFQSPTDSECVFLVPELRGVIAAEKRQAIRIKVDGTGAEVQVERLIPTTASVRGKKIESDTEFLFRVRSQYADGANAIERIIARFREIETATAGRFLCGFGSSTANLYWMHGDATSRIFQLSIAGRFRVWVDYLVKHGREDVAAAIRQLAAPTVGISPGKLDSSAAVFAGDQNVSALLSMIDAIVAKIDTLSGAA